MAKQSAGILVYRRKENMVEVLLVHPAGPFWGKKDTWSIPKGETEENEDLMTAAKREFTEEVGFTPSAGKFHDVGLSKQGSKTNYIWAVEGDFDPKQFKCTSTFTLEWPPKSGQQQTFPENDRAKWFKLGEAKQKLFKAQTIFIDRLAGHLHLDSSEVKPEIPSDTAPEQSTLF